VVFPKRGALYHHSVRRWSVAEAAKAFDGMQTLLQHLEAHDVTLVGKPWSAPRRRQALRLLSKHRLVFAPP
jgi:hypothetical protein